MVSGLSTSFLVYILSGKLLKFFKFNQHICNNTMVSFHNTGSLLSILTRAQPLKGNDVTKVEKGKYPYVVSIVQKNNQSNVEEMHICTGVLITSQFILTAAHCFDVVNEIEIIIGSVDLRKGKRYDPSVWVTYNRWVESKNNLIRSIAHDIAIVKVKKKKI